ncbi:MAG: THUMP domain-containing class I SAM-dependent RNA methyltransferase [Deltaproteobacteria bacterium]
MRDVRIARKGYDGRMSAYTYFATTSKGLEGVLAEEIAALGGKRAAVSTGGVSFSGDRSLCYRANLWLRTASRVLMKLSEFPAPGPEELYEGVKAVPWPDLFSVRRKIAVEAAVRDSVLTHSGFAAQKAKDAVVDRFREKAGARPDVDAKAPDVRIHLRILRDACILSLDTSGESLNRRGYRAEPSEASLRETLAAGIVLLSGWDGHLPLADPACGAGTLLIEAALIAARIAPGSLRTAFGFQNLADYRPSTWASLIEEAKGSVRLRGIGRIEGGDIAAESIRGAGLNAKKAGIGELLTFRVGGMREFSPGDPPGVILCNPPYGVRMAAEGGEIADFYRDMGEAFKRRCSGWTAYVLSGNPHATRFIGLKASRRFPLMNGPIDCRLLKYELY